MQDLKIYKNKTFKKKKILEILSNKKFIKKKIFFGGISYPPLLHHVKAI